MAASRCKKYASMLFADPGAADVDYDSTFVSQQHAAFEEKSILEGVDRLDNYLA